MKAIAFFHAHPQDQVPLTWNGPLLNYEQFRQEMLSALHRRINARGKLPQSDEQRRLDFLWDRDRIQEYLYGQIRHTGCRNLLRTQKLKRKYPQIDNQPLDFSHEAF